MSASKSLSCTSRSVRRKVSKWDNYNRKKEPGRKDPAVSAPVSQAKPAAVSVKKGSLREEFVKALKVNDRSDRTIKTYCDAVNMFQCFINKSPLNVSVNDIRAFFFT